jgi:O-antigen/teichoic acid export membrane protein
MIRKFLKDVGIYGMSATLSGAVSFFLIPVYVQTLSPEEYGIIDLIALATVMTGVILSLEIYQAVARFFPESDEKTRAKYASTGLLFLLFSYGLFALAVWLFATPISQALPGFSGLGYVLRLAAAAMVILGLFSYSQNLLRYSMRSSSYAVANIVYSLGTISFSVWFVVGLNKGLEGVYYGQIAGGCLGASASGIMVRRNIAPVFDRRILKKMIAFSIPMTLSGLAVYALIYADRVLIKYLLGLSDLGVYAVGSRIAAIPIVLTGVIASSFVPIVYTRYKESPIKNDMRKIYHYVFFAGLALIALISIFSSELIRIIATPDYIGAITVIPFLLTAGFLMQYANMFMGITLAKKTPLIAAIYLSGLAISILLNLTLIPLAGITGAAVATAITGSVIFVLQWHFSQKYYFVEIRILPLLGFTAIVILSVLIAHLFLSDITPVNILLKILLLSGCLAAGYPLAILSEKQRKSSL